MKLSRSGTFSILLILTLWTGVLIWLTYQPTKPRPLTRIPQVLEPWPSSEAVNSWAGSISPLEVPRPKRIILICVDTLRSDHLSSYGYRRSTTPNLDRLAEEEGILFENVYASSSWTLPSIVSVFTSLHPSQHRVEDRSHRLNPRNDTLAGSFAAQGWLSAAFITHIYVSSLFGLDTGFLEFRELSIDWNFGEENQMTADYVNARVLPWLGHHISRPFFLYIHLFDPHWDYAAPPPWNEKFTDPNYQGNADGSWGYLSQFIPTDKLLSDVDLKRVVGLYDGEIAWTDYQINRIFDRLKSLGAWDDTLVMIFSDHGEEFQEHDSVHHIRTLYEEVLRVPLIVKLPGGRPTGWRERVTERVGNIDIAPTILNLAGLRVPPSFEGESLIPLMSASGGNRDVYARTLRHKSDKVAIIHDNWKLIHTFTPGKEKEDLFNLKNDPSEQNPLSSVRSADFSPTMVDLRKRLAALQQKAPKISNPAHQIQLTPQQEDYLKSLGYIE